jgi:FecR protein
MKTIKLWHAGVMAAIVAVAAGAGVWLYQKHSQNVEASTLPDAARIQRVDGQVALTDAIDTNNSADAAQWRAAGMNEPFSVGDRMYTRENSHASLAFNSRNYARLYPNTAIDAIALTDDRTQLALRDGAAMFDVGYLPSGGLYEVGTPYGAVDFNQPGLYYVDVSRGNAMISVLSGLAQVVGLAGNGQISKGEMLTLIGTTAGQALLSRLNGNDAGYLVDDYYRYQYPNYYDGRYVSYDTYLADPYYFDPYRNDVSYRYVSYVAPGINDLSYYGDWTNVGGYGYGWSPRVDAGWSPYSEGYWVNDYPYGLTWVSTEPWGYAPYHYGRWAYAGDRWYWIPDAANTAPVYSPALVAFLPYSNNEIGWVPLGPGDAYIPRYYDENWQPHYLTRGDVVVTNLVNWSVPNAVTVMPIDYFDRPIDGRYARHVNPSAITQVRPTLEPLLLTPLRNAALRSAWGRGKIDLPPGIAKKLQETPVVVGSTPAAPPFRKNLEKSLRVERVTERGKNEKIAVQDQRNTSAPAQNVERQSDKGSREAFRGSRVTGRESRQLDQQQRTVERSQPKVEQPRAMPRAEGGRVGNPGKARPEFKGPPVREAPRPQIQRSPPVREAPRPQIQHGPPVREAPRPQIQRGPPAAAPAKHQDRPAPSQPKPGGGGGGGGKGKGKKP